MHKECPHCGLDYFPEPGFYFGAMFISYIITGWFAILFIILLHWVCDLDLWWSFGALILFFAIFFVYIFRISRMVWLQFSVKYEPGVKPTNNSEKN